MIRMPFYRSVLLLAALAGPLAGQAPAPQAVGTVQGTVRAASGVVIVGAEVVVEGSSFRTLTGEDGRFSLAGVPAGTVRVSARRLGYVPQRREVVVPVGAPVVIDFRLAPTPAQMEAISVTARREPADSRLAGFRSRAESQSAGHIFTRSRIEQSANRSTMDLLRTVPGFRLIPAGRGSGQTSTIRFRANRCPPLVFIDGHAATASEFDLEMIDLHMVEGIEVYPSSTSLPAEFFAAARGEQCGVIAIWSRPAQPRPPRPRPPAEAAAAEARSAALGADEVDEVAYTRGGNPEVVYPDSLWRTSTPGDVLLEFVVDARGTLQWSTLLVVSETHPYFTRAVLEALMVARWEPAKVGTRRVAQLVVLPVRFVR